MKNFKKILSMSIAAICSVSYFNLANAWDGVGITQQQIEELPHKFNDVWKTLKPGTNNGWDLPEDEIIDAAKRGQIELNCVVRAKILKDILVNWNVLGATLEVLGHLFVIAVKPDGTILALNVFGDELKGEKIELHIEDIDSFVQSSFLTSIPVVRDNVSRLYYGGLSLGAWMRMISLSPNTDKDICEGFQKKIKEDFMKGTIFFQPFMMLTVDDKFERTSCVLLPSELTGNEYDSLKKLDTDLYNVALSIFLVEIGIQTIKGNAN